MKTHPHPVLLAALALLSPAFSHAYESAAHVLADPVSYTGWSTGSAPMNQVWQVNSGNDPVVSTPASGNTLFTLNNGVTTTALSRPLTSGFDLTLDALHTSYGRLLWVGLFNSAGTQGYGLAWDSSSAGNFGGQGFVSIRRFNNTTPPSSTLFFNTTGTQLGGIVGSGHIATSNPLAKIRLTWSRDTGTLQLYVDDVLKQTVVDSSFGTFARLYAGGTTGSLFDNVSVAMPAGAIVPFVTHEAESPANTTTGTVVTLTTPPGSTTSSPELEASGRAFVQLSATGAYLDIPVTAAANTLVLRHCIPDSSSGGGLNATLNLYVNGALRQTLALDSKHNWLYGTAGQNGQSNSPSSGTAHVFWNETPYTISGAALSPGDVIRLRKDSANTAAYYRIDLVDLENAPAALPPPAANTYLSVVSYGANGNDASDDSAAIIACIAAAQSQGRIVWIPAGTYYQSQRFTLNGVRVQGAGLWHTRIVSPTIDTDFAGNVGFTLSGSGAGVSHLRIESSNITSRSNGGKPFTGSGSNWTVDNVWITRTNVAFWMSVANQGVIRDCRVRQTYADGINLNRGSSYNLVENNHVRGCGDDGMAILAETERSDPPSQNNTLRQNTVIANWWGHNLDLGGGSNHIVADNCLADNALFGGLAINMPSSYPMYPVQGCTLRGNLVVRGGGNYVGQQRGAVWIYPGYGTISTTALRDNHIVDSIFKGIQITGSQTQQITFDRNFIDHPGTGGIVINTGATGSGTFTQNTVADLPSGQTAFTNGSSGYTATLSGNNF